MSTSKTVFFAFVIMAILAMLASACGTGENRQAGGDDHGDGSDTGSSISEFIPPPLAEGIELIPVAPTVEMERAWRGSPVIDGNIVVWEDIQDGRDGMKVGLYGYDLSSQTEWLICPDLTEADPAISGTTIVWVDNGDIYGCDLLSSTDKQFPIYTQSGGQFSPVISGDIVVWADNRNGNGDIYGYDLSTGTEFPICTDPALQGNPCIDGQVVVWEDNRNSSDPDIYNFDIYGYDLSTKSEFSICTNSAPQYRPDVSGNIVVWQDNRNSSPDIYGYNLSTETEFVVCNNSDHQICPSISGDIVVWEDRKWKGYDIEAGLYGYDLSTQSEFTICPHGGDYDIETPSLSGSIVVWRYQSPVGASYYIYGAKLPE